MGFSQSLLADISLPQEFKQLSQDALILVLLQQTQLDSDLQQ
jgi:hypothetical protein